MDTTTVKSLRPNEIVRGAPLNPRVLDAEVLPNYQLKLLFTSGEIKVFDARPYLELGGVFDAMKDPAVFDEAWVEFGSVEWPCGVGLSYDTLYLESVPVETAAE